MDNDTVVFELCDYLKIQTALANLIHDEVECSGASHDRVHAIMEVATKVGLLIKRARELEADKINEVANDS